MKSNATSVVQLDRASESSRKQRDGTAFIGGFGKKTGDSDLLFVEGQLPEDGDRIASDEPPARQLERCLKNLEAELERHGTDLRDVLKLTLYLAEMDAYERVNDSYEQYFDETHPARTTVGVCELLGGAAVTVDAVVAIE
jgi:2-iminobutanoate/2-iminopropanoate deaminase